MNKVVSDADVLRAVAKGIVDYCNKQEETIASYLSKMQSLTSDWDDQTCYSMIDNIKNIANNLRSTFDQTKQVATYIQGKADLLASRKGMN